MFSPFYMLQIYFLYMYYLFCQQQIMLQNSMRNIMQFMSQNMTPGTMQFMPQNMTPGMMRFMPQNMRQNMKQLMDPDFLLQHADLQKLLQIDVSPENLEKLQQFLEFFFDTCSKHRKPR